MSTPFGLGRPGCGAYVLVGPGGSPRPCGTPPTHCGLCLRQDVRPVQVWLAFTCPSHINLVDAAGELLARDRAVLEAWREQIQLALAGRGYEKPQPLATGPAARALHRRAVEHAAAQNG